MERKLILSVFVLLISKIISSTGDELDFHIISPPEKVPLHHALYTLEEVVKDGRIVHEFCDRHFARKEKKMEQESIDEKEKIEREEKTEDEVTDASYGRHEELIAPMELRRASNCAELYKAGVRISGIYTVYFRNHNSAEISVKVYCDMESAGGGWTVFQRRGEFLNTQPRPSFNRSWNEYKEGFGNLEEEFWLGNEFIHRLSTETPMELRVELRDFDGTFTYAAYDAFEVGEPRRNYTLTVGDYSGNAGNSLGPHCGMRFATYDFDNKNCAHLCKSGWWFNNCRDANLNGEYLKGKHDRFGMGVLWTKGRGWFYSYKWTEMKMRPKMF